MADSARCPIRPIGLDGHCGYFRQNFTLYLADDGTYHWDEYVALMIDRLMTGRLSIDRYSIEPIIRFGSFYIPPRVRAFRDELGFTIAGPHFSVVTELAKFLNYRF